MNTLTKYFFNGLLFLTPIIVTLYILYFIVSAFDRPLLVTLLPGNTVGIMGFITRDSLENIGMANSMAVYIPQSYNFAGNMIVVPKEQVIPLEVESGKAMTFIVSGGVSGF